MQHNGNHTADKYFYLHDRLASVRQIINTDSSVVRYYTYKSFGEAIVTGGSFDNPFLFTGQWFDPEIGQYYLLARQYDPKLFRFTSRDPVFGKFEEPMTLHKYLYCGNEPVNTIDPKGEFAITNGITINATDGTGGATVTIQSFYGMSDDLDFFCGYMVTVAGGPQPTLRAGLSGSISGLKGYSPDAQSPEDFSGLAFEVGGSGGAGFNAGVNWTFGLNGVTLRTVSFGYGAGVEAHGQLSQTFVFGDWALGSTANSRTRSPFEQYLTNLFGEWGSWGLYP